MLYRWGIIDFEVYPVNLSEVEHVTGTDWARKEIAGAAIYREWVGEGDEEIHLRGKLFPHFYAMRARSVARFMGNLVSDNRGASGIPTMDVMDNYRRQGQAHLLIRGDGWKLGWYVIEKLSRSHTFLGAEGVGQQINFEATFMRVPVPDDPGLYFPNLFGAAEIPT